MINIFPGSKGHHSGINRITHHGEAKQGNHNQSEPEDMLGWQDGR